MVDVVLLLLTNAVYYGCCYSYLSQLFTAVIVVETVCITLAIAAVYYCCYCCCVSLLSLLLCVTVATATTAT